MKVEGGFLDHDLTTVKEKLTLAKHDLDTIKQLWNSDCFHDMTCAVVYRVIEQSYKALLLFHGEALEEVKNLNQLREACMPYFPLGDYTLVDLLDKLMELCRNPIPSCGLVNYEKDILLDANRLAQLIFDSILQLVGLTYQDISVLPTRASFQ